MTAMKGVHYLVDETGKQIAIVLDLDQWGELLEDFFDSVVSSEREHEPRRPLRDIERELDAEAEDVGSAAI